MQYPVLITTAVSPPKGIPSLKMSDISQRLIATRCSIFFWAAQGVKKIVIADATGFPVLDDRDIKLIEANGTLIESLAFKQDERLVVQYGKAFGEGRIIRFDLENSELLKQDEFFYKCTGKCFCRNFPIISNIIEQNKIAAMFWRLFDRNFHRDDLSLVDTRFFFASRSLTEKTILPTYEDSKNISIERTLAPVLSRSLASAYFVKPLITGFAGGVGGQYDEQNLGQLDQSFPGWVLA